MRSHSVAYQKTPLDFRLLNKVEPVAKYFYIKQLCTILYRILVIIRTQRS